MSLNSLVNIYFRFAVTPQFFLLLQLCLEMHWVISE